MSRTLRRGALFFGSVLFLALAFVGVHFVDWRLVELRTTAGSVFSEPKVDARLIRKLSYGVLVGWQSSSTLEVTSGGRRYRSNLIPNDTDELQISPSRKTIAVHSRGEGNWWFYVPSPRGDGYADGAISLEEDRTVGRVATLTWASADLTPVPTDWRLVRIVAVSGVGALAVLVVLVRSRKRSVA